MLSDPLWTLLSQPTQDDGLGREAHLNDVSPHDLLNPPSLSFSPLTAEEPMLHLLIVRECLCDVESTEVPPQQVADLWDVSCDHFPETGYSRMRGCRILPDEASDGH